jgi:hypothetical protein
MGFLYQESRREQQPEPVRRPTTGSQQVLPWGMPDHPEGVFEGMSMEAGTYEFAKRTMIWAYFEGFNPVLCCDHNNWWWVDF